MGGDTANVVAYVFYVWAAISGVVLIGWLARSRWMGRKRPSGQSDPELRPGPPVLDLRDGPMDDPPRPPRPPWVANLERFTDLDHAAAEHEESIEIRPEDLASALETDVAVPSSLDSELTDEIAPALVTEPPEAAKVADIELEEAVSPPSGLEGEEETEDEEDVEDPEIDLRDGPAEPAGTVPAPTHSEDLYAALAGICLPLGLTPENPVEGDEYVDVRFIFHTTAASMDDAGAALIGELVRLGYVVSGRGSHQKVARRTRPAPEPEASHGERISETVVMTMPPFLDGDPVRIALAIEVPEPAGVEHG